MPNELLAARGAIAAPLRLEVSRELTQADLTRLHDAARTGVPPIQKIRAIHHRQALLLAEGKTPTQVAAIVGCTVQRLVQLQNDPTFTDLMSYYKDQMIVTHLSDAQRLQGKLIDAGEMAMDEIISRLEDPEKISKIPIAEVRKIVEMASDRTVAPPKTSTPAVTPPQAITINFGTSVRQIDDTIAPRPVTPTIDLFADDAKDAEIT